MISSTPSYPKQSHHQLVSDLPILLANSYTMLSMSWFAIVLSLGANWAIFQILRADLHSTSTWTIVSIQLPQTWQQGCGNIFLLHKLSTVQRRFFAAFQMNILFFLVNTKSKWLTIDLLSGLSILEHRKINLQRHLTSTLDSVVPFFYHSAKVFGQPLVYWGEGFLRSCLHLLSRNVD